LIPPSAIYRDVHEGVKQVARATQVHEQIKQLVGNQTDNTFELADLLCEARENQYYREFGFDTFKDYVEAETEFRERQAYYIIRITTGARQLGIDRQQLKPAGISKLKHIFTLDVEKFADDIRRLVAVAPRTPLAAIIAEVKRLKGEAGEPEMTWVNFYMLPEAAEKVHEAVGIAKLELGNSVNAKGEEVEPSSGMAIESIVVEWMEDPNRASNRVAHDLGIENG
jgi:hypothetical protein